MSQVARATHIVQLKSSMENAINAGELQQIECPLDHYFTSTQYARRIYVQAGATVVTAVHKSEHVTIALKGHCVVVDELGGRQDVVAPAVFVTQPGTQRAVYAVTDTEWVTVHTYDNADKSMDLVRKTLVCETMEEYTRLDYYKSIAEVGISEATARTISEYPHDLIPMPEGEDLTYIGPSVLEGQGVFAATDIASGSRIAPVRIGLNRTPAGRYTNHSDKANAYFLPHEGGLELWASADISKDEEITVNYREARLASFAASELWETLQ